MKTQEWKFDDTRKLWSPGARDRQGPWDFEPDKRQWTSESRWNGETGFPCLIVRNHFGALCGYVGVPRGHPWYGQRYDDVDGWLADLFADSDEEYVHGGLTFSGFCGEKICHEVEPGEDDDVWWLGFDCAHAFDIVPGFSHSDGFNHLDYGDSEYRNFDYVKVECEKLAKLALRFGQKAADG